MFKKIFFILSLVACCFEFAALAQLVPQTSRSVTSPQADNVDTTKSIIFVIGNDGKLHQLDVDSNGNLFVSLTGTVTTSPAAGAIQVVSLSNTAGTPFFVTPATSAYFVPLYRTWSQAPSDLSSTAACTIVGSVAYNSATNSFLMQPVNSSGLPIDNTHPVFTSMLDGQLSTFSAAVGVSVATSATDILTIAGSGSRTIRITKIEISGEATAAGNVNIFLIKRSTADSGGTAVPLALIPHDTNNNAVTAAVNAYTANPTLGTNVGTVDAIDIVVPSVATPAISPAPIVIDFTTRTEQAIVLRGTAQQLAINLNGVTVTGGQFFIKITWTEL